MRDGPAGATGGAPAGALGGSGRADERSRRQLEERGDGLDLVDRERELPLDPPVGRADRPADSGAETAGRQAPGLELATDDSRGPLAGCLVHEWNAKGLTVVRQWNSDGVGVSGGSPNRASCSRSVVVFHFWPYAAAMSTNEKALEERIADELRAEMARQDRSIRWLAEQIGESHVTVARWVKGRTSPGINHLDAMCRALSMTIADLLQAVERNGGYTPTPLGGVPSPRSAVVRHQGLEPRTRCVTPVRLVDTVRELAVA